MPFPANNLSEIPNRRARPFFGRERMFANLDIALLQSGEHFQGPTIAVLSGLAGQGKT